MDNQLQGFTLAERGKHLLDTGHWSDCCFIVGDEKKIIKASRCILAMASPVFEAMLYGPMAETESIPITSMQPDIFYKFLLYIYARATDISSCDEALEICRVAHSYMMPDLVEYCAEYIKPNKDNISVLEALNFATFYNIKSLEETVIRCMSHDVEKIMSDSEFQNGMTAPSLATVLKSEDLIVEDELNLFHIAVNWAKTQCQKSGIDLKPENVRTMLNKYDIIKYIRFLCLSHDVLATEVQPTGILTQEEMLGIYQCITLQNSSNLPQTISPLLFSRNKRMNFPNNTEQGFRTERSVELRVGTDFITVFQKKCIIERFMVTASAVILTSVRIATRTPPKDLQDSSSTYYEAVDVQVEDEVGTVKAGGSYYGLAPYGRNINVKLVCRNVNITFLKDWTLLIKITYHGNGVYPLCFTTSQIGAFKPTFSRGLVSAISYRS